MKSRHSAFRPTRRDAMKLAAGAALASVAAGAVSASDAKAAGRTFVLVHGAWHGGWVWDELADALRAQGHTVTTPTLTGLGENAHALTNATTLEMHVDNIVAHINMWNLENVDLVGWSYGGMVTTGVLARIPDKIRSMIYLDAFVPENGKSLADYAGPAADQLFLPSKTADQPIPAIPAEAFGVQDASLVAFVNARTTPQPWRTFYDAAVAPATRPDIPYTYVVCRNNPASGFDAFYQQLRGQPNTQTHELPTSHHCMLTAKDDVLSILLKSA